jgi:hypothetical protein
MHLEMILSSFYVLFFLVLPYFAVFNFLICPFFFFQGRSCTFFTDKSVGAPSLILTYVQPTMTEQLGNKVQGVM